jgi:hypothetical protein
VFNCVADEKIRSWLLEMWLLDSGCTLTMGGGRAVAVGVVPGSSRKVHVNVITSNKDGGMVIDRACDLELSSNIAGCKNRIRLNRILTSDKLSRNLLSTSGLCDSQGGLSTIMDSRGAKVVRGLRWKGEVVMEAVCVNGLYLIPRSSSDLEKLKVYARVESLLSFSGDAGVLTGNQGSHLSKSYTGDLTFRELLHVRTGHIYGEHIDKVFGHHYGKRDRESKHRLCHTCGVMCMQRRSMKPRRKLLKRAVYEALPPKREVKVGDELHHDWQTRKSKGRSREGFTGTELCADRRSGRLFTIFCHSESEMQEGIVILKKRLETQLEKTVKFIHGDSSRANKGKVIEAECIESGTETRFSPPHVKERNWIETRVKVWKKVVRCIDYHAGCLPDSLWPHTDAHAALIVNVVPVLQPDGTYASPLDVWEGVERAQRLKILYSYGCLVIAWLHKDQRNGGQIRGMRCVNLGFDMKTWAFKLLVIETRKIITTPHVSIYEVEFPFRPQGWIPRPVKTDYAVDEETDGDSDVEDVTMERSEDKRGSTVDSDVEDAADKAYGDADDDGPESADEGVRFGASFSKVCNSPVGTDQPDEVGRVAEVEDETDEPSQTVRAENDEVYSMPDLVESEDETEEPSQTVRAENDEVYSMPDLEESKYMPTMDDTTTVGTELKVKAESGVKSEEPIPVVVEPESARSILRRSDRGVRQVDHGAVISHHCDDGRQVLGVQLDSDTRTAESIAASVGHYFTKESIAGVSLGPVGTGRSRSAESHFVDGGDDGFGSLTQSGEESCHFTVPIEVKGDTAYYKGIKVNEISVPRNFNHVKQNLFKTEWEGAMEDEYNPLVEKGTWIPVYKKEGEKAMGCLWVYSLKINREKKEMRFKARLCAQGSGRMLGVDHTEEEVYANVLKLKTLRINLALAIQDPEARVAHWDIKNAFVATDMPKHKVVLMRQPQGYYVHDGRVLKLMKALYGLPESMRLFTDNLKQHLVDFGFTRCKSDPSMYVIHRGKEWVRIPVWVDDLFPTYNSTKLLGEVFTHIKGLTKEKFELIDMGELSKALGVEFKCDWKAGRIEMRMDEHKRKLLASTGMEECNPTAVPMMKVLEKPDSPVTQEEAEKVKGVLGVIDFRSVVGSAGYFVQAACPLLAYVHSVLARFSNGVTLEAAKALRHLLRYIKGTIGEALVYKRQPAGPELRLVSFPSHNFPREKDRTDSDAVAFTDASFADDKYDCKSQTGMCVFLFGCPVVWKSRRQSTVATSTYHAETIAAHEGATEIVWIRLLLKELKYGQKKPSVMWQDNAAVVRNTYNPTKHEASKHIRVKYMWKRELLDKGVLIMLKIPTKRQVSDVLTKPLMKEEFRKYSGVLRGEQTWPEVLGSTEKALFTTLMDLYWPEKHDEG